MPLPKAPTSESVVPVILTCALTGGIHGKEANPALPEQPDEIVEQGIAAHAAGAAVLHIHARQPDGASTVDPAVYQTIATGLAQATDAIVQLTTGASPRLSVEKRLSTVALGPEMCSLNMGLLNFFIDGEQVFFPNHRSDIDRFAREMHDRGVKPELEIYSAAMLEEAERLIQTDALQPPYALNLVLNTPTQGGERGTPENLMSMLARIDRWSVPRTELRITVSAMGRTQLPLTTIAVAIGLNARVGLEDNVYYRAGELAVNNASLVARTARIAAELERPLASPQQARVLLGLGGFAQIRESAGQPA